MTRQPDERTAELASQMRISVGRLRRRLVAERDRESVPTSALAVLCALERHGTMSVGELAAHEQVRPPSMTRTVRGLEVQGCALVVPHPGDGRVRMVALTAHGRQLVRADREAKNAWLACRLERLDPEERKVLELAAPLLEALSRQR